MYKKEEIVLVSFNHTDFSGKKIRPCLIISNNIFNDETKEIVATSISSSFNPNFQKYRIPILKDQNNNLICSSFIKINTIYSIHQSMITKKIGKIDQETFNQILKNIYEHILSPF